MSPDVPRIAPAQPEPVDEVIALLEQVLDEARRGEVCAVALVTVQARDRRVGEAWAPPEGDMDALVYALWCLDTRLRERVET